MNLKSVYITADTIGIETGGGVVTGNELEALRSVSEVELLLSHDNIAPELFRQPDSPFLYDYFALQQVRGKYFDLAHFYSWTFTQTVSWLKSQGTKVTYTVPFHDRTLTVKEFERLGLQYPFPHIKDDDLWQIYSDGYRLADVVIAPSKMSARCLKAAGCKNVVVIPHGTELPKESKPIPERFDVSYLGAVGPDKGVLYLIQAWAMLNYPDSSLILAGSGTETLEPFIRQVANQGQFKILGRVPNIADVYNACSVYVQPSVVEGFGIEVLEAMAHGRPVIASEGAGASDLVDDSTGFVVPIRSPEAIAEKINWFKNNRERIPEMGQRARRKARNYCWTAIRSRYTKSWRALLEERVKA